MPKGKGYKKSKYSKKGKKPDMSMYGYTQGTF